MTTERRLRLQDRPHSTSGWTRGFECSGNEVEGSTRTGIDFYVASTHLPLCLSLLQSGNLLEGL